jgi:uncharacterized membrane protein YccF (DUF307 family)
MSFLGNILWLIFGGFLAGMGYIIGGLLFCLTIIGIPFGMQAVKLGVATLAPFGKNIVATDSAASPGSILLNILWAVLFGWEIAVAHFVHGLVLAVTIIGLPFAKQHFKLIPIALAPFGREIR